MLSALETYSLLESAALTPTELESAAEGSTDVAMIELAS